MIQTEDLISYLAATDQLDDFLGFKENVIKCPNCQEDLYIYEKNLFYCKKCKYIFEHNKEEKVANKSLTLDERKYIRG